MVAAARYASDSMLLALRRDEDRLMARRDIERRDMKRSIVYAAI